MSEENGRTDLTWRELLDEGGARLSEAGVPDAGTDAWYLMEAAFGIDRVHYYLDQNRPIHAERLEKGSIRKCFRNGQSAFHCSRFWECRILWE